MGDRATPASTEWAEHDLANKQDAEHAEDTSAAVGACGTVKSASCVGAGGTPWCPLVGSTYMP